MNRPTLVFAAAALLVLAPPLSAGCGTQKPAMSSSDSEDDGGIAFAPTEDASGSFSGNTMHGTTTCTSGLCLSVPPQCAATTSLSGIVYDPAGQNPIYDAIVFVPNDPNGNLPAITTGTHTCGTCDANIQDAVAVTTTDPGGHFKLTGVPATSHVPFVVQVGKWRRRNVFIPSIAPCKDTPVSPDMTRLPRKQSEGDMPQMALLTGGCDDLGCFLKNVGIDATEFSSPHGGGRLDVYRGGDDSNVGGPPAPNLVGGRGGAAGNCAQSSCPLWSSRSNLEYYDIVLLACECTENQANKPDKTFLHDWVNEGGKVFTTHYQYTWFKDGPADFQHIANWNTTPESPEAGADPGPFRVDTSFPKGEALYDLLANRALFADGTVPLNAPDVKTSVTTVNAPTVRWIYDTSATPNNVKYMSIDAPVGGIPGQDTSAGPQYCGKAVFTDIHTSGTPQGDIPSTCAAKAMTPQEKALEFLFFDLSACVQSDTAAPPTFAPR
jgi:hypothetical protein